MCDLWIWEVDYGHLKAYLPQANSLAVWWRHPAYEHAIVFNFQRRGKLLKLKSCINSEGKLTTDQWRSYIPYPRDLRRVIDTAYPDNRANDGCGWFVYDPLATLAAFRSQHNIAVDSASRDIIRRKLLADVSIIERSGLMKKLVDIPDLNAWIEEKIPVA